MNENNTQNVIPNVDSKSKEERNVPALRFTICDWKIEKLSNIAHFKQGDQYPINEQKEIFEKGYIRFIRIIDYTQKDTQPRYVDTFEEEEEIDIHAVMAEIKELESKRAELDAEIEKYLKELGL